MPKDPTIAIRDRLTEINIIVGHREADDAGRLPTVSIARRAAAYAYYYGRDSYTQSGYGIYARASLREYRELNSASLHTFG
jgi:hypothetical protein